MQNSAAASPPAPSPRARHGARYDVLIVGCGPVGATLGSYLGRFGHAVGVFDRDLEVFPVPRAMGFDEETLRILHDLDQLQPVVDRGSIRRYDLDLVAPDGRVLMGPAVHGERADPEFEMTHGPFYPQNLIHQPHVEEILREDLDRQANVDVFLGHEVLAVDGEGEDEASVRVRDPDGDETIVGARYLVGCDGGRSLVRRSITDERIDFGYSEDWLVVDADADPEYYETIPDGAIFVRDADLAAVVCKGLHGHVRFDALRLDGKADFRDAEVDRDYTEDSRELIGRHFDPSRFTITRQAPYRFYAGMPARWRRDRLFVAGDAAHQTPPFAGQGLNMGMRDAANLAFKLDLVLRGRASDAMLDTYEAERRPACSETIKGAVHNGGLMRTTHPLASRFRDALLFLARHSKRFAEIMHSKGMRKPAYEAGLVGSGPGAGAPLPRTAVVDAEGRAACIDDVLGVRFALLATEASVGDAVERFVDELDGVVVRLGRDLRTASGDLERWLEQRNAKAVLVRPDRYVFDAGEDANALCASLFEGLHRRAA
ncbi:MAG: bifunctional 3-(3-hydroxy-phenyl)propionate/3-hydroxycinnamic acid hydroxylase [Myxococcota bacterium]